MTDEHTHFEAVTYPEAEREAMTLTDKLAALPPEPPAIKTIGETYWYSYKGVVGLNETEAWARYYQDKAEYLLARNALLCEALRAYGGHFDDCAGTAGFMDERCDCGLRAVLAACEVKP